MATCKVARGPTLRGFHVEHLERAGMNESNHALTTQSAEQRRRILGRLTVVVLALAGCESQSKPIEERVAQTPHVESLRFPKAGPETAATEGEKASRRVSLSSIKPLKRSAAAPVSGASTVVTLAQLDAAVAQREARRATPAYDAEIDRIAHVGIAGVSTQAVRAAVEQSVTNGAAEEHVQRTSAISSSLNPLPLTSVGLSAKTATTSDTTAALRQVEAQNIRALQLAMRGAIYSARTEFSGALRLTAAGLDGGHGDEHLRALQTGVLALAEAEDFVARDAQFGTVPNPAAVVRGHRSGVLDESAASGKTADEAHADYLAFARRQLAQAVGSTPCGSVALHGLGKVTAAIAAQQRDAVADGRAKAEVFYLSALDVDANNYPAANDLAVLLAENGRFEQARGVIQAGLRVSPQPAMWNNLASIHARLGEHQLAAAARWEASALAARLGTGSSTAAAQNVQWVDAPTFAAAAQPHVDVPAQSTPARTPQSSFRTTPQGPEAQPARRPIFTAEQPRRTSLVN